MQKRFTDMINFCAQSGYSDLHLCGGQPLVYRKDGFIKYDQKIKWTHQEINVLLQFLLNSKNINILRERWSVDFATTISSVRIRVNVFNTDRGPSLSIRLLPGMIPDIAQLNLHPLLKKISDQKTGLILICGTTGCGKTTTIASLLDDINHKRAAHVVTLEDPIEYRIPSRTSFIEQREVGTHVPSIERGLIDVMRADPDIIMVGELREPQSIMLTLNAAESGHLVIATLHATNMEDALYRIINSAPPEAEEYLRHQLASTVSWIIVQKLVYMEKIGFSLPVLSILRGTQQIKGIIREKKLYQIENALHTGKADGMFTQERYLKEYLELLDKYQNPFLNFKPGKDTAAYSDDYSSDSTFFNAVASSPKTPKKSFASQKFSGTAATELRNFWPEDAAVTTEHDDSHYVIDESDDLQKIIAETEKIV